MRRRLIVLVAVVLCASIASIALAQGESAAPQASWTSILPPLLAIVLAMVLREVVVSLVAGVWLGATFIHGYNPLVGLLRTADTYAVGALAEADHASIVIFSLVLGGMIGVIARSGGARGMAELVVHVARTRLRGALATWLMGVVIFFDDYCSALLVGTTMRPITDRLRISREKLSFLVDALAAPVSSFAVVSSWVGVQVGYIADQYAALGIEGDPYIVFLETLPRRFYPLLTVAFGFLIIVLKRDFGPMWAAENRAVVDGHVSRPGADVANDFELQALLPSEKPIRARWLHGAIPIALVVVVAIVGMYVTGSDRLAEARDAALAARDVASDAEALAVANRQIELSEPTLRNILAKASSLKSLLWAALLGGLLAILMSMGQRILTLREAMEAWVAGVRSIALAVMILVLAWSIGDVCQELHTAAFLIGAIGGWMPPTLLPAAVFVIAACVSFATGTSWGTMGILFPLVVPLAHQLAPEGSDIVLGSVAAILSGAVWGDHCSPISDTTIMSAMSSSCDLVDHVRTQLPYALAVGGVSLVVGEVATGLGIWGAPIGLVLGALLLVVLVRFIGKPVPDGGPELDTTRTDAAPPDASRTN